MRSTLIQQLAADRVRELHAKARDDAGPIRAAWLGGMRCPRNQSFRLARLRGSFSYWHAYDERMTWGPESGATAAITQCLEGPGAASVAIEADGPTASCSTATAVSA